MGTEIILKHVRAAFAGSLFTPKQYDNKGAFNNGATFILEPGSENDKILEAAIQQEAQKVWGKEKDSILEEIRYDKKAYPYMKRDRKKSDGKVFVGFEGKYSVTGKKYRGDENRLGDSGPPLYLHKTRNPATGEFNKLTEADGLLYAGAYVNVKLEIWAQGGKDKGVRSKLLAIQFDDHGDSFGGATIPTAIGFEESISVENDDLT